MIQPHAITNFSRTEHELQEFLLFCVCVAGKSSEQQARKLEIFLAGHCGIGGMLPFAMIRMYGYTGTFCNLELTKMGQYKRITKAFCAIAEANLDLKTCTVEDLEKIPGVGLKTSRFFLTHSRPNQCYAILDTHILTHMRNDLAIPTPKTTPTNPKKYYDLESKLLEVVRASGKSYADYDLEVWSKRVLDKKNKAATIAA
jgi:thermostable 8-oxoguanine DNA glycosylase